MIVFDKRGKVIPSKLDDYERPVFRAFLMQERARHQEDIKDIDMTLRRMKL